MNHTILLSEDIFTTFTYGIHNKRYKEDIWIQKHVLASVFANAFRVAKFSKLKDV